MADYRSWVGPLLVVVLILAAGYLITFPLANPTRASTQTMTASPARYTVNLAYKAGIGFYLTNASGFALYFRASDPGNGTSTCYGPCVTAWPLFYAGNATISLPPNLSASSFGTATRTDGQKETTFNGYPLYFYVKDTGPGQVSGEGKGKFYACCSLVATSTTTSTSTSSSSTTHA